MDVAVADLDHAPMRSRASRCRFTGRAPMAQPPGRSRWPCRSGRAGAPAPGWRPAWSSPGRRGPWFPRCPRRPVSPVSSKPSSSVPAWLPQPRAWSTFTMVRMSATAGRYGQHDGIRRQQGRRQAGQGRVLRPGHPDAPPQGMSTLDHQSVHRSSSPLA